MRAALTPSAASALLLRGRLVVALAPDPLVEARRSATGDGDRGPVVPRQDAGDEDDLPDVVGAVGQRPLDRQRHGMRLAPDGDGPAQATRSAFLPPGSP